MIQKKVEEPIPFVGREEEIQRIMDILPAIQEGKGELIGIRGEAGIGKSRFITEIIGKIKAYDVSCYYGSYDDRRISLAPIREIILKEANIQPDMAPEERQRHLHAYFAWMIPQYQRFIPIYVNAIHEKYPRTSFTSNLKYSIIKQVIQDGWLNWITTLCKTKPVLMVWENIHWGNESMLDILAHLSRNLKKLPFFMIVTYRPDEKLKPFEETLFNTVITLHPLTPKDQQHLLHKVHLEDVPTSLIQKANGNALFLSELIHHCKRSGDSTTKSLSSFNELEEKRIQHLSEPARITLGMASVIGDQFSINELKVLRPESLTEEAMFKGLEESIEVNLLFEPQGYEKTYAFQHSLIRNVLYDLLEEPHRHAYHQALAYYYQDLPEHGMNLHYNALHLEKSDQLEAAVITYIKAGHWYYEHNDKTCLDHYEYVIELLQTTPSLLDHLSRGSVQEDSGFTFDKELVEVYYRVGKQYLSVSLWQKAIPYFEKSKELAGRLEWNQVIEASLNKISNCYWRLSEYEKAEHYATKALASSDPTSKARANLNMGHIYGRQSKTAEALNYFDTALLGFHKEAYKKGEAGTLGNIGVLYAQQGRWKEALYYMERSYQQTRLLNQALEEAGALNNLAVAYQHTGNYTQALFYQIQSRELRTKMGDRAGEGTTLINVGTLHQMLGNFEEAEQALRQSIELTQISGDRMGESMAYSNIGTLYYALGKFDLCERYANIGLEKKRAINYRLGIAITYNNLGMLYGTTGKYDKALDILDKTIRLCNEINNKLLEAYACQEKGLIYFKQQKYDEVIPLWNHAYEANEQHRNPQIFFPLFAFMIGAIEYFGLSFKETIHTQVLLEHLLEAGKSTTSRIEQMYVLFGEALVSHSIEELDKVMDASKTIGHVPITLEIQWWRDAIMQLKD